MQTNLLKPTAPQWLEVVAAQVSEMRFGVVQIVVHDSRVVQIERTEKVRLSPDHPPRGTTELS